MITVKEIADLFNKLPPELLVNIDDACVLEITSDKKPYFRFYAPGCCNSIGLKNHEGILKKLDEITKTARQQKIQMLERYIEVKDKEISNAEASRAAFQSELNNLKEQ